jgi:hypothetical protein
LWHVSHPAVVGKWFVGLVTMPPIHCMPVAWQLAQPLAIPLWFMRVPGPNINVD